MNVLSSEEHGTRRSIALPHGAACFPPDRQFRLRGELADNEVIDLWQQSISNTFTALTPSLAASCSHTDGPFRAEMKTCELGGVAVSSIRAQPHVVSRDRSAIRHTQTDKYFLVRQVAGESAVEFDGGTARMGQGDFALVDPEIPYRLVFTRPFEQQCVQIPQLWLREQLELSDTPLGNRLLSADAPMVRMLGLSLDQLIASASEDEAIVASLSELFLEILLRSMKSASSLADEGEAAYLTFERVRCYIAHNYTNFDLSPKQAAHDLGCSVRSLHRICALAGTSFGRLILDTRLSASHQMLHRQPALFGQISRVAFDTGFSDQAYFCRVFKERYGATPRAFSRLN